MKCKPRALLCPKLDALKILGCSLQTVKVGEWECVESFNLPSLPFPLWAVYFRTKKYGFNILQWIEYCVYTEMVSLKKQLVLISLSFNLTNIHLWRCNYRILNRDFNFKHSCIFLTKIQYFSRKIEEIAPPICSYT